MTPEQYNKAQMRAGQALAVVGGASSIIQQGMTGLQEANSINTDAPTQATDPFGRPLYNLGQFAVHANSIKPQGAGASGIASGALQGAAAGAAFGGIGAAGGAVVGGVGASIFGRRKKKLERRKRDLAMRNLTSAQQLYNISSERANQARLGKESYQNTINFDERLNNLYTFNN